MTSANLPHTPEAGTPRLQLGKPPVLLGSKLARARQLQRQGFTLSEIAEELDVRDGSVIRALYDDVVCDK